MTCGSVRLRGRAVLYRKRTPWHAYGDELTESARLRDELPAWHAYRDELTGSARLRERADRHLADAYIKTGKQKYLVRDRFNGQVDL